jgi:hypothetical protein
MGKWNLILKIHTYVDRAAEIKFRLNCDLLNKLDVFDALLFEFRFRSINVEEMKSKKRLEEFFVNYI